MVHLAQNSFCCFCHRWGQSTILPAGKLQTLAPSGSFFPPALAQLSGSAHTAETLPTCHHHPMQAHGCCLPGWSPHPGLPPSSPDPTDHVASQPSPAHPAHAACCPHNKAKHPVWPEWPPLLPPLPPCSSALALSPPLGTEGAASKWCRSLTSQA